MQGKSLIHYSSTSMSIAPQAELSLDFNRGQKECREVMPDLLKSVAIFGVVYIHGASLVGSNQAIMSAIDIFRFGVPIFIVIWAYFIERSHLGCGLKNRTIIKGLIRLLIPFLVWSAIYFLLTADFDQLTLKKIITRHWSGYGWSGQYFFIVLFQLILIYPMLRWLYDRPFVRNGVLIILMALYISQGYYPEIFPEFFLKMGDRPFFYWVPYVFIAIYLARHPRFRMSAMACFAVFLIPIESALWERHYEQYSAYISPAVLFASAVIMFSTLHRRISGWIFNDSLRGFLQILGSNTMGIFVMNPLVILLAKTFMSDMRQDGVLVNMPLIFIMSFIVTVMIVAICLFVTLLLRRTRLAVLVR